MPTGAPCGFHHSWIHNSPQPFNNGRGVRARQAGCCYATRYDRLARLQTRLRKEKRSRAKGRISWKHVTHKKARDASRQLIVGTACRVNIQNTKITKHTHNTTQQYTTLHNTTQHNTQQNTTQQNTTISNNNRLLSVLHNKFYLSYFYQGTNFELQICIAIGSYSPQMVDLVHV